MANEMLMRKTMGRDQSRTHRWTQRAPPRVLRGVATAIRPEAAAGMPGTGAL